MAMMLARCLRASQASASSVYNCALRALGTQACSTGSATSTPFLAGWGLPSSSSSGRGGSPVWAQAPEPPRWNAVLGLPVPARGLNLADPQARTWLAVSPLPHRMPLPIVIQDPTAAGLEIAGRFLHRTGMFGLWGDALLCVIGTGLGLHARVGPGVEWVAMGGGEPGRKPGRAEGPQAEGRLGPRAAQCSAPVSLS